VVTGTWLAGEPVTGGRRAGRLTAAGGPRG
jgi:hypothetical protein